MKINNKKIIIDWYINCHSCIQNKHRPPWTVSSIHTKKLDCYKKIYIDREYDYNKIRIEIPTPGCKLFINYIFNILKDLNYKGRIILIN